MIKELSIPNQFNANIPWILAALCFLVGFQSMAAYILPGLNLILGLMAAPIILTNIQQGSYSQRYGWLAVVCLCSFAWFQMKIFFLLGMGASAFFVVESRIGKLGILPLILLILISPVPFYLTEVFTFPIRLWMSEKTAELLTFAGFAVQHEGNFFTMGHTHFSVDPACMGLNSMITGLMFTILMLAFVQKQLELRISVFAIGSLFVATIVLLIFSNFIRMSTLVLLHSLPETLSHEIIGIICLILYVALPMYFLIRWVHNEWGFPIDSRASNDQKPLATLLPIVLLIGALAWFNFHRVNFEHDNFDPTFASIELPGYQKTLLDNGIAKFEKQSLLVYIKPPSRVWGSDHSPRICWAASGYQFTHIKKVEIDGFSLYVAQLEKESDILHTAWWYENGETQTHSQLDWRMLQLKGAAPFRLINLTSTNQTILMNNCSRFLNLDEKL